MKMINPDPEYWGAGAFAIKKLIHECDGARCAFKEIIRSHHPSDYAYQLAKNHLGRKII